MLILIMHLFCVNIICVGVSPIFCSYLITEFFKMKFDLEDLITKGWSAIQTNGQ